MRNTRTVAAYILGIAGLAGILALAIFLNNNAPKPSDSTVIDVENLSTIDIDNGDLKIDWSTYPEYDLDLSENATIAKGGIYHVAGELEDAPLVINAGNDKVKLVLNNVSIKNSKGPAIVCYAADDLVIELKGENVLHDGNKYDSSYDDDVKGVIYSKADLTFEGSGSLILTANYQDGIVGKDDVKFNSGNYTITAADDAIRGKDSVYIVNGDFNITSRSDGIKSTNAEIAGKGFVLIENGHIKIAAGDDAIHAEKNLYIYNGNIDITKSYEGLEAADVTLYGGNIKITSSDDGINGTEVINITGGDIYVNASGDGIDSNGYVYINGGNLTVDGPTNNGNGALDSENGIIVKGGTVVAVGASGMAASPANTSTQYSASIFFDSTLPADTKLKIKKSSGDTIFRHTSAKSFSNLVVSMPEFQLGETYSIYVDDEKVETFTLSNVTTIVGNSNNRFGPGQPGDQPGEMGPGGPNGNDMTPPEDGMGPNDAPNEDIPSPDDQPTPPDGQRAK